MLVRGRRPLVIEEGGNHIDREVYSVAMRCDDPSVQTVVSSGISVGRERVYHFTSQSGTKGYEIFVSDFL